MNNQLPTKPMTRFLPPDGTALDLAGYREKGGYEGLQKALALGSDEVLGLIKDSNLRGRGGAGFPTGLKWSFVPRGEGAPETRYLVVNGDEMEPGAFKDRLLLESTPHLLLEGMMIGACTLGAQTGYIFLRGEYVLAAQRIRKAIEECYQNGLLGSNILGSGVDFDVHLHTSAGRYICGEETALINSLEGKRATPRSKPPFPQVSGLWGKPTVVNNVETYCNLPHIVQFGADWFKGLGKCEDSGTKLFGVSGRVRNPGLWELPMGTTVREVIETHAGGMCDGYQLKGYLPGGGSTDFMLPEHLDTPMDYDAIGRQGSRMGTATIIVLDDKSCPVRMVLNLVKFFSRESCGWCTPCRDGLPWTVDVLERIENGYGKSEDIGRLEELARFYGIGNTYCALAPGAAEPLESALRYFREDFEQHITEGCCPYRKQNVA